MDSMSYSFPSSSVIDPNIQNVQSQSNKPSNLIVILLLVVIGVLIWQLLEAKQQQHQHNHNHNHDHNQQQQQQQQQQTGNQPVAQKPLMQTTKPVQSYFQHLQQQQQQPQPQPRHSIQPQIAKQNLMHQYKSAAGNATATAPSTSPDSMSEIGTMPVISSTQPSLITSLQDSEHCNSNNGAGGKSMSLSSLMPQSWKQAGTPVSNLNSGAASLSSQNNDWSKFAPTKEAFAKYVSTAGSARLSTNSKGKGALSRQVGVPLLLMQKPKINVTSKNFSFNDSSNRMDLVAETTGSYPIEPFDDSQTF